MIPVKNRCQFSWYCDGLSDRIHDMETFDSILSLTSGVVDGSYRIADITEGATHYHADYVEPAWAKTKTKTIEIEDHIFYRWETTGMNIFYLSAYPDQCAEMHCDKHVCKMIIEYAQIMSTAHRVLDGEEYYGRTKNGRRIKRWKMNSNLEDILYKASHVNHPSNQWVRASISNYTWLYEMWECLCNNSTYVS